MIPTMDAYYYHELKPVQVACGLTKAKDTVYWFLTGEDPRARDARLIAHMQRRVEKLASDVLFFS